QAARFAPCDPRWSMSTAFTSGHARDVQLIDFAHAAHILLPSKAKQALSVLRRALLAPRSFPFAPYRSFLAVSIGGSHHATHRHSRPSRRRTVDRCAAHLGRAEHVLGQHDRAG